MQPRWRTRRLQGEKTGRTTRSRDATDAGLSTGGLRSRCDISGKDGQNERTDGGASAEGCKGRKRPRAETLEPEYLRPLPWKTSLGGLQAATLEKGTWPRKGGGGAGPQGPGGRRRAAWRARDGGSGEERGGEAEKIFEETMAGEFQNLMKHSNPLIQESLRPIKNKHEVNPTLMHHSQVSEN